MPAVQGGLAPFEFPTVGGGTVAWKPGRVTVINAIALWCDTWKEQRQRIETARSRSKGLPVDFLTVSIDGRWRESADGQGERSILLDQEGLLKRTFDLDRIPMTLLLDTEGKLAWSQSGVVRSDDLVRAIQRVIEDPLPRSGGGGLGRGPVLYLTFDDFPAPHGNDELLDILRREDVPATLFCIGRNVSGNGDVLERALREGHGLGIHSWNHDAKTPEIERCRKALEQLGASADLYRPPGSTRIERLDGTPVTKTALDPSDYRRPGERELLRRLKSGLAPGKVIQLHAGVLETLHVLPEFIRFAREKGYRFERLAPETDKSKVMVPSRSVRKA
ncbi:MAG: polysaccharide deacetylase family protein [Fimbriimonadaceae bacterium]|nr:polysaccharide deacetylase family protein [Fimbriimonadaceae bacterium]